MPEQPVGSLRVDVKFDVSKAAQQQLKTQSEAIGRESGQAQARASVGAAEREFRASIGRIKEGQVRGFLSPSEAAKAGREAAQAYNQAITRTIDQGFRTGAFRGGAGRQVLDDVRNSIKNVGEEGRRANLGLGRLNDALVTVARTTTGLSPVAGKLVDTLGTFAIGTAYMIPVLGGLAAIGIAWEKITRKTREAREETERAQAELAELARVQALGVGGERAAQLELQVQAIAKLREELKKAQNLSATREALIAEGAVPLGLPSPEKIQEQLDEAQAALDAGIQDFQESMITFSRSQQQQTASDLAALISANKATEAERARAFDMRQRFLDLLKREDLTTQQRAEILQVVNTLSNALDQKLSAAEKAEAKELDQAAERLRNLVAVQREFGAASTAFGISEGALPQGVVRDLQEIVKLEEQIAQTEEDIKRAGGLLSPEENQVLAQSLEAARARVAALRNEVAKAVPKLQEAAIGLARISASPLLRIDSGELRTQRDLMRDILRASRGVAEAERELAQARRTQDPERIAAAERALAMARSQLVLQTGAFARAIEESNLPLKVQQQLLAQIDQLLKELGIDMADFTEEASKLDEISSFARVMARGLLSVADGLGLISSESQQAVAGLLDVLEGIEAIQRAKEAEGLIKTLGFASGGLAIAGGLASVFGPSLAAIFGGNRDAERAAEPREAVREFTAALEKAVQSIEDVATRLAGANPGLVGDIRATSGFLRGTGPAGIETTRLQRAGEFFGVDFSNLPEELFEEWADFIDELLEEAKRVVQQTVVPDFQARGARLRGDSVAAATFEATAAYNQQLATLEDLREAEFITQEQFEEFAEVLAGEFKRSVEEAEEAVRRATVENDRRRLQFESELAALEARNRGASQEALRIELEADATRRKAAAEDYLAEAVKNGTYTVEEAAIMAQRFGNAIDEWVSLRLEEAERAAQRQASDFRAGLEAGEARLAGNDRLADEIEIKQRAKERLDAANELHRAGIISREELLRFAKLLDGEVADAIQKAADAAEDLAQSVEDDVELLELEAQGRDKEARIRRQEIADEEQLQRLRDRGATEEQIARARAAQEQRRRKLIDELFSREEGPLGQDGALSGVIRRDVTGITTFQAVGINDSLGLLVRLKMQDLDLARARLNALLVIAGGAIQPGTFAALAPPSSLRIGSPSDGGNVFHLNGPLIGSVELADASPQSIEKLARGINRVLGIEATKPRNTRSSQVS